MMVTQIVVIVILASKLFYKVAMVLVGCIDKPSINDLNRCSIENCNNALQQVKIFSALDSHCISLNAYVKTTKYDKLIKSEVY